LDQIQSAAHTLFAFDLQWPTARLAIVHPEVVGKASGRTNLTDGLQAWKPARQQTWKSAVQKIRQQRRVAPGWQSQMII
jgi:hypothetical protein